MQHCIRPHPQTLTNSPIQNVYALSFRCRAHNRTPNHILKVKAIDLNLSRKALKFKFLSVLKMAEFEDSVNFSPVFQRFIFWVHVFRCSSDYGLAKNLHQAMKFPKTVIFMFCSNSCSVLLKLGLGCPSPKMYFSDVLISVIFPIYRLKHLSNY